MLHLALLLAALAPFPAPDTFRALNFDQAKSAAQEEKKVVLIDFFTTWCVPCKKLDETTWKDEGVVKWLGEHCVALKLDAEKNAELAKSFHVEAYPTVLLLKADGSVIDRLVGYKDAKEFISAANDALAGKDSLARAREKLAGHEKDPMERESYADELSRAGKYEQALAEYLWCFDEGKSSVGYGGVRRSFLLSDLEQLGRRYPAAIAAMEQRRDAAESRVRAGPIAYDDIADAVALNKHLKATQKTLELFDDVRKAGPLKEPARLAFFLHLKEPLRTAKRYADLLDLLDRPTKYVTGQIQQYEFMKKRSDARAEKDGGRDDSFERSRTTTEGVLIFEALVGTKRDPEADQVADALIAFDATGQTYAALIKAADRTGAGERVKALGERGLASLPEKEQAEVKQALASSAKPK